PTYLKTLPAGAPGDSVQDALVRWLLRVLQDELSADPGYWSIPAEVDDLAEALREFARHLTGRLAAMSAQPPADALSVVLHSGEREVEASWPDGPLIHGRLDAIFKDRKGAYEVIEYKMTDEANVPLDQAQAVLYQRLYALSEGADAQATVLRFTHTLRETNLAPAAAESVAHTQLSPLLNKRVGWARAPLSAPPTERRDLGATCPMAGPCALHYPQRVAHRDDPPVAATRPRNVVQGEGLRETSTPAPHDPLRDEEGIKEAEQIRDRIVEALGN